MPTYIRFTSFLKKENIPQDLEVKAFITWLNRRNGKHPLSSDPDFWVVFLYKRLTKEQAAGFRKVFALYYTHPLTMVNKNRYPTIEDLFIVLLKVQ